MSKKQLEDNFPLVSHISSYLVSRGPDHLCSRLYFLECFYSKQSWWIRVSSLKQRIVGFFSSFFVQYRKDNVSLWGKSQASLLVACCNIVGFPELGVPQLWAKPLHATHPKHLPGSLWVALWDMGDKGNRCYCETQAAYYAMSSAGIHKTEGLTCEFASRVRSQALHISWQKFWPKFAVSSNSTELTVLFFFLSSLCPFLHEYFLSHFLFLQITSGLCIVCITLWNKILCLYYVCVDV